MENEKFNIYFYKDIEWFIIADGIKNESEVPKYEDNELAYSFGVYKVFLDGKIGFISDINTPNDATLKTVEKYEYIAEICTFNVYKNDKFAYKFTGTFIDALEYIKANFGK
ncbi:hypothetical protein Q4Y15_001690 [Campylobacter fetus]|uniref:Uncharacterized protein n=3 Tax=Campylobacter fetus TaxID=196 RepID=A0RNN7_CAMFF|nr:hypothetical protein [Campylobacter fetus]OCS20265.1 hypothetical protein CFVI97532_10060 [Campylobacter fetus subsp. venerealis cfvi97/532]ABK82522.1 hypothetical protein CFF8240_0645 [Campylobacter fetus subsp. fetus 82-40]EAI3916569.1 hypothetical protein [Campylobacter fetus]EAI3919993.1 hypothetical protein [Campylobacter fetus]EAI8860081.1 hypothetical protein [Campylobacter fetus]